MDKRAYAVYGLSIRSDIALPGLAAAPLADDADVDIRRERLPIEECAPGGYSATALGTLLNVPRVGRYLIRDGREILVEPRPAASDRNLRLFLLGSAFGALLHQRGLLPLHANAIDLGGRAVAFAGHSGAGKLTIAAWFHDRGCPILADDVCVIGFVDGAPVAYPGLPRLRLWREALEASGRAVEEHLRSYDDTEKYDVPTRSPARDPLPLDRVYLLGRAPEAKITRLTGVDAVEALVANTYRGAYLRSIGRTGAHLTTCLRIARAIPVFEAARVWGFEAFDGQAERLDAHARARADADATRGASARRSR